MDACPRCGTPLSATTKFCPQCGTQVRVQPVQGEVIEHRATTRAAGVPSPWVAGLLSIVPGLGHWYAGAPRRGFVFFVAIVAGEVLGIDLDLSLIGDVVGIPLGAGATGLWVFCAFDAYRTAARRRAESG
jgi:RNA polymerase subunit RPABC4/transcription elongation factor Spt4